MTPGIYFPWPATRATSSMMRRQSAGPTVVQRSVNALSRPIAPLLPEIGKLWSDGIFPIQDQPRNGQMLALLDKKPDGDKPLMLGINDTSDIGPQCPLVKNDDTMFLVRLGGAYSQKYPDLSDGKGVPEVLLGCQVEQQLSQHNKVSGTVECAGDPADLGHHRVRAKAAWEVLLDSEDRLRLRTSVLEASNYAPNGEQAKNLSYALDLVWRF
jgi:hypothetical protein